MAGIKSKNNGKGGRIMETGKTSFQPLPEEETPMGKYSLIVNSGDHISGHV